MDFIVLSTQMPLKMYNYIKVDLNQDLEVVCQVSQKLQEKMEIKKTLILEET